MKKGSCIFWISRKGRFCTFSAHENSDYCPQHLVHDPNYETHRVVCPLDPKHTVFVQDLERHLKRCNAIPRVPEIGFEKDINSQFSKISCNPAPHLEPTLSSAEEFLPISTILHIISDISKTMNMSESVANWKPGAIGSSRTYSHSQKNILQHDRIIKTVSSFLDRDKDYLFIELGAGKAGLTAEILKHDLKDTAKAFILIDKANTRKKV